MHRFVFSLAALCTGCGRIGFDDTTASVGDVGVDAVPDLPLGTMTTPIAPGSLDFTDIFGAHVVLSSDGSTLLVGAHYDDSASTDPQDDTAPESGAAFVFTPLAGGGWTQAAFLKPVVIEAGDDFGLGLSISHDGATIAIGAPDEDSAAAGVNGNAADNSLANSGAVTVFERVGSTWSPTTYIKASNPGTTDRFGYHLALSGDGNTLAVGAYLEDSDGSSQFNESRTNSGALYVFARAGATWTQVAYLKPAGISMSAQFGTAVAFSDDGTTLVATSSTSPGLAGVYTRSGNNWIERASVVRSMPGSDGFGRSVSVSANGDTFATAGEIDGTTGAAYVFTRAGTTWVEQARLLASNPDPSDYFGYGLSLSASGNTLVVGSPQESSGIASDPTDNNAAGAGAAYRFTRSGGAWTLREYIKATPPATGVAFGSSVSLSGTAGILAVGSPDDNAQTGHVDVIE